eukprot:4830405-Prymnesium_polylepis.1
MDTWFRCEQPQCFLNARTGVLQSRPPDGNRADGTRRRSAATEGPWAVPFRNAPPPLGMDPPATGNGNLRQP